MKKIIIIFLLFLCFGLTACMGPSTYDEISFDDLMEKIDNKDDFLLLIGSSTCTACQGFKPTINKIITEYKMDIKYIDVNKLSDDQSDELLAHFRFSGTPIIVFVKNGKEKDPHNRIVGNQKYSKVVKKLKENGYIKE